MLPVAAIGFATFVGCEFQWAPTLGGECYYFPVRLMHTHDGYSFSGHPPLGVNATHTLPEQVRIDSALMFQWAPTLGGECYFRYVPC